MLSVCISCRPAGKEPELIFEMPHWKVTLMPKQAYLGKPCVTLKRHCGDPANLTEEERLDFAGVVGKFKSALRKTVGAAMFNWTCLMNKTSYQSSPPEPARSLACTASIRPQGGVQRIGVRGPGIRASLFQ